MIVYVTLVRYITCAIQNKPLLRVYCIFTISFICMFIRIQSVYILIYWKALKMHHRNYIRFFSHINKTYHQINTEYRLHNDILINSTCMFHVIYFINMCWSIDSVVSSLTKLILNMFSWCHIAEKWRQLHAKVIESWKSTDIHAVCASACVYSGRGG